MIHVNRDNPGIWMLRMSPLPQHWNWNIDFKNPPSLEANLGDIN
jgi:hypothetical protein